MVCISNQLERGKRQKLLSIHEIYNAIDIGDNCLEITFGKSKHVFHRRYFVTIAESRDNQIDSIIE